MLRVERTAGVTVVALPPDVDASNADSVGEQIMLSVGNEGSGVVIDVTATRYLDSAGIDMLFRLHERLQTRRQRLHLVAPEGAALMRVLRIVAIPDVIPTHGDLETALAAARGTEGRPVEAG